MKSLPVAAGYACVVPV